MGELTAKQRLELQKRLLTIKEAVGKIYNLLPVCNDTSIKTIVEGLEKALGIQVCPCQ